VLIYVAGPIDQAVDGGVDLRAWVYGGASKCKVALFDPGSAYWNAPAAGLQVNALNRAALEMADAVLALLPVGVPTIGTPMELQIAQDLGKPWAVVSDAPSLIVDAMRTESERVFAQEQEEVERAIWRLCRRYDDLIREQIAEITNEYNGRTLRWTGEGQPPIRHYEDDAGWDLTCSAPVDVHQGEFADIPCSIRVQLPEGTWGLITGRSSTLRKRGLLVAPAIIDGGYRGPLFAGVFNLRQETVRIEAGERLAQLIPVPLVNGGAQRVEELDESARGARGFGSTGT
jgi:dUTP pyrophosphatase